MGPHAAAGRRVDGLGYPARMEHETGRLGATIYVRDSERRVVLAFVAPEKAAPAHAPRLPVASTPSSRARCTPENIIRATTTSPCSTS